MKTRLLALVLCIFMLVPLFCSCSSDVVTAQMYMYFSHQVYDLDPLNAYTNDAQLKIVSLLFSGLYKIDVNGRVTEDLAQSAIIDNDEEKEEYSVIITLKDTYWSDGQSKIIADDVIYTFRRVIKSQRSNDASSLLWKIQNAAAVKNGEMSIDDLGVSAIDTSVVQIRFDKPVTNEDLDELKLMLTSPSLFPLREIIVDGKEDWAKKPASIACSGPFTLRKVSYEEGNSYMLLERNPYYLRNIDRDAADAAVTPYRIRIEFTDAADDLMTKFDNSQTLFVGEIPLSLRNDYKNNDKVKVTDLISTHTYYFNQNALIASTKAGEENGIALFANAKVRQALSLVINREDIANQIVFAKPATGLLTGKMFADIRSDKTFRSAAGDIISASPNEDKAASLLAEAGINPENYSFSISVREIDEVHVAIAEAVAAAWNALGFNVTVKTVGVKENDDKDKSGNVATDIRDDLFDEEVIKTGDFEVVAIDYIAKTPSAFSALAPFAIDFTGNQTAFEGTIVKTPHITGYNSEEYNTLINEAFAATGDAKVEKLVAAEKLLLEDAAIVPIVFNQSAVLVNDQLMNLSQSYYGHYIFTKSVLKDWSGYNDIYFPETTDETVSNEEKPAE